MFIECPTCTTKFIVQAEKIGQGRKVRCSICKHQWFYEHKPVEAEDFSLPIMQESADYLAPIPEGGNVPAIIFKPSGLYRAVRLSFVLVLLGLCMATMLLSVNRITTWLPFTEALYHAFGIHPTDRLVLHDVSVEALDDGRDIHLQGVIVNQSDKARYMPSLRVSLYSRHKQLLGVYVVDTSHLPPLLPPSQEVAFEQHLKVPRGHTATLTLDMGAGLELALR